MDNLKDSHRMLQPEHQELLAQLVEAHQRVPRDERDSFRALLSGQSNHLVVLHPGFPGGSANLLPPEIRYLSQEGMIDLRQGKHGFAFDITSRGHETYTAMQLRTADAAERVEVAAQRYIDGAGFKIRHSAAYAKWMQAESLLWETERSATGTTEIGHYCREALQEFITTLLRTHRVENYDSNAEHTKNRFKSVVASVRANLGNSEKDLLDALVSYLEVVYAWANRQEHGNKEERAVLTWQDGRRVVFQTLMVMYEIDQSLAPLARSD